MRLGVMLWRTLLSQYPLWLRTDSKISLATTQTTMEGTTVIADVTHWKALHDSAKFHTGQVPTTSSRIVVLQPPLSFTLPLQPVTRWLRVLTPSKRSKPNTKAYSLVSSWCTTCTFRRSFFPYIYINTCMSRCREARMNTSLWPLKRQTYAL